MKNLFYFFSMLLLVFTTACSKSGGGQEEQEKQEETLSVETIENNLMVNGSTKISGMPPTPNEAIDMSLPNVNDDAFLNEGFIIPLSSTGSITGAYLQVKDEEGNLGSSYLDIDLNANGAGKTISGKNIKGALVKREIKSAKKEDPQYEIDIDFTPDLTSGTFCYVICVYDAEGNISAPQEQCVTVREWGGNQDLVGNWELVRTEEIYEGSTVTTTVGEEDCDDFSCDLLEYDRISFSADGTYESESKYAYRELDEDTYSEIEIYIQKGTWYFDTVDQNLLLSIQYERDEDENGLVDEETYAAGEAYFAETEMMTISGNTMTILFDISDDNGDGVTDESFKAFYEKK